MSEGAMSWFTEYSLGFDQPWFLLLLVLIPALWVLSFRSLAGLGAGRRLTVLGLRTLVFLLVVMAIAGFQMRRASEKVTVIYLVDLSLSIPPPQRRAMIDYVNAAVKEHRQGKDRAGVVVFGRDAAMEIPPFDEQIRIPYRIETNFDPEFTNLEGAMKLAEASFPEDAAKRVVVVTDGNQNMGNAERQARGMAEKGISIDVVPIRYPLGGDVLVEKITLPSDVRKGQPFDLRIILNNTNPGDVSGLLRLEMQTDDQPIVLNPDPAEQLVTLRPGKNPMSFRLTIEKPHFYKYRAEFIPHRRVVMKDGQEVWGTIQSRNNDGIVFIPRGETKPRKIPHDDIAGIVRADVINENNKASTFTHVRGSGRVLFVEDCNKRGEFTHLVERLRAANIEVTVRPSDNAFSSLPELQQYDTVVMANLPRDDEQTLEHLTENQIKMLVSNTEHTGGGIVMIGGDRSFGVGGWQDTELEKAMPLDFRIKNAKVVPKGALAMVMHASETNNGNHWMKLVAREAIKALGNQDYCGVMHWNGNTRWLWNHPRGMIPVGNSRNKMLARLGAMTPGDMPDFAPTMQMALTGFARLTDAAKKHMIIISDGDPSPPSNALINQFVKNKITVSTVEVSSHGAGAAAIMQKLARATGGKYYKVLNNKSLPRIYQKEVRRVARPLIYNEPPPFSPQVVRDHEIVSGIEGPFPAITGYVMTTPKQNPLVEIIALAPRPKGRQNPILAAWEFGLGRTVCLTTDAGRSGEQGGWANSWIAWENYDKLFSQMVRWSMRPSGDEGNFSVVTQRDGDKVRVIVQAFDKEGNFQSGLPIAGLAVDPKSEAKAFTLKQKAPGRYEGEFSATDVGSYMVVLNPGKGRGTLRAGINVPYSAEFRSRETNEPLLKQLKELTPDGGKPGELIDVTATNASAEQALAEMLKVNSFRHDLAKATSSQDAWHYLVLMAALLFFCDVFCRRVQVGFEWVGPVYTRIRNRLTGRQEEVESSEYMTRLRSRKDEVSDEIEARKAAARFEPQADVDVETDAATEAAAGPTGEPTIKKQKQSMAPEEEEESYTDRLLKAKKKAWEDKNCTF